MSTLHCGTATRLARLVAMRLCQDFGSPLSTLTALMPQAAEGPAHALLTETVGELRARQLLFCALFGDSDLLDWAQLGRLLGGAPMAHRVRFDVGDTPPGPPPTPATLQLLLATMLLAAEALPRGGIARLAAGTRGGFTLLAEGRDGAWPPALVRLLAGGSIEAALAEDPRRVLAPWAVSLAAEEGRRLDFAFGVSTGLPALALSAPG